MLLGLFVAVFFAKLCEYNEPYLDEINQSSKSISLWEICLIFLMVILLKAEFTSDTSRFALFTLLTVVIFAACALAMIRTFRQFLGDCHSANLNELAKRDRSISNISRADRNTVTAIVYSPFDTDQKLAIRNSEIL